MPSAACALVSGLSNLDVAVDGGSQDGSALDQASRDGPPQDNCDCGTAAPPAGFSLAVFAQKDNGGNCAQFTTKEAAFSDPQNVVASGACSCGCTVGGCTPSSVSFHTSAACIQGSGTSISGGCQASPSNYATATFARPTFGAPTCTSGAGTFPRAYTDRVTLCTSQLGHCAQFCAVPKGAAMCFVAPGDVACPPPLTKTLVGTLADTRACTGCTCNLSASTACVLNVRPYADSNCATALPDAGATALDGSCGALAPQAGPYMIGQVGPVGSCTSTGGTASGGTTAGAVRTVCCP